MTSSALDELRDSLESARFPKLTKPHFFVAYSHRADSKVRVVIQQVLHQYGKQVEFTDWAKVHEPGNINTHIAREVARSRFGICYLSEPAETGGGQHAFVDNPNVVFEAGMLHARTSEIDGNEGEPCGWIPVREAGSPPAPFDFASERILHVPRYEDGTLDADELRQQLVDRIEGLLHQA
ncbi:TIR domain-containing protein [Modestobacter altitudinis]|uniref:TIR domain-containing protein n=1 Tax=Modestobacter altitudinis TaxID=2213158 RepID=UPI00110CCE76|nr:TIR domain-containing protein [Modestobacter altitudinis]